MYETSKWDYIMNLFSRFILGRKKYMKLRLYDKKRQLIKQGDEIVFTNLMTAETIAVKVTEVKRYESFKAMYEQIDKKLFDREER